MTGYDIATKELAIAEANGDQKKVNDINEYIAVKYPDSELGVKILSEGNTDTFTREIFPNEVAGVVYELQNKSYPENISDVISWTNEVPDEKYGTRYYIDRNGIEGFIAKIVNKNENLSSSAKSKLTKIVGKYHVINNYYNDSGKMMLSIEGVEHLANESSRDIEALSLICKFDRKNRYKSPVSFVGDEEYRDFVKSKNFTKNKQIEFEGLLLDYAKYTASIDKDFVKNGNRLDLETVFKSFNEGENYNWSKGYAKYTAEILFPSKSS